MSLKRWTDLTFPDLVQAAMAVMLLYWTFRYAGSGAATIAVAGAGVIGLGLLVTALARVSRDPRRQDRATLALGVGALVAPLLLGFTDIPGAMGVHAKAGIVVLALTGLRIMVRDSDPPGPAAA